jgi:hypothetical protein
VAVLEGLQRLLESRPLARWFGFPPMVASSLSVQRPSSSILIPERHRHGVLAKSKEASDIYRNREALKSFVFDR